IPFPPDPDEQRAITTFLDRQTAKIDALIAKKRGLIAALHEQRSAIISHAVTKGLNPDAPMKDSGIEWVDSIPAHWQVQRLKFVSDVRSGVAKGRKFEGVKTVELPYLRVANVQTGHIDLSEVAEIEVTVSEIERYSLKVGDVLMNEGGDYDKLGRGAVWQGQIEPCLHQNHVFAVRPYQQSLSLWITTLTLAQYARFYFMINSKQSTNLASISSRNLSEFPVIMPPQSEREQILGYIEDETRHIDRLTAKAEETIERLQEYRAALISAAVTGKIDVRTG
ncbi:restriction endonuclease subunit S, partial [Betaproteobacteria bacterium PRO4]|nr:restriction endonuclease subunit S [Betaproteobacteria bacterium PRO4]